MKSIRPQDISTAQFHAYMLGAIAPRPIAFASTIDKNGNVNLSPFSFFNAFGSNPPILIFSPARRVRDNTEKHTLENVREVAEVTINIVNYSIVEQMSLASTEYDKGVDEFVKSGLTASPSTLVKPPFVAESPVAFECKVNQVIETGKEGGAGNLIVCEIIMAHIKEEILDEQGKIDTKKIDLVGRMGGDWYVRANHEALFEIEKPNIKKGIGVDNIPQKIRLSHILSGNNLGKLGNIEVLPSLASVEKFANENNFQHLKLETQELESYLHQFAKKLLENNQTENAWKTLLYSLK
ncbi:MAG: flavin reductase family protein [Bacteroidetes bacterium]|nr:MAG: flavin reductase family protein [Bacteroidota bacterium]TAG85345.1 MAG: flavin reductase family protein [Bacteroidota bacterium]